MMMAIEIERHWLMDIGRKTDRSIDDTWSLRSGIKNESRRSAEQI